jgi:hypothetical protein
MSLTLVREYIQLSLNEKIRGKFNLAEFKTLETPQERLGYCTGNLEFLGKGSARAVFMLSSGKVLKIAIDLRSGGKEQNYAETEFFAEPAVAPILTKIFDHDDGYMWIIAELVRPLVGESEFLKLLGLDPWQDMGLEDIIRYVWTRDKVAKKYMVKKYPDLDNAALAPVINALNMARKLDINQFDIGRYEHWGKTVNGRPVLLDYGLVNNMEDYS